MLQIQSRSEYDRCAVCFVYVDILNEFVFLCCHSLEYVISAVLLNWAARVTDIRGEGGGEERRSWDHLAPVASPSNLNFGGWVLDDTGDWLVTAAFAGGRPADSFSRPLPATPPPPFTTSCYLPPPCTCFLHFFFTRLLIAPRPIEQTASRLHEAVPI